MDTKRTVERNSAVIILSHGRADNMITIKTLSKVYYTGKLYILIDDQDPQGDEYKKRYGEKVIVFCKNDYFEKSDTGDYGGNPNVVLPARNAVWDIAKNLGLTHFVVLDDDYLSFGYRFGVNGKLKERYFKNADFVFNAIFDFLDASGADVVALAQNGDMIGGVQNTSVYKPQLVRKAMNVFFFRTDRPYYFYGRLNEDATAYVLGNQQGKLIFTLGMCTIQQVRTQANKGGLTEAYLEFGTYLKSFYSVIFCPSAVKIGTLGLKGSKRIHHSINWDHTAPKILDQRCCHHDIGDNL